MVCSQTAGMMIIRTIVVVMCTLHSHFCLALPPVTDCDDFVTEGEDLRCKCRPADGDPSCSVSWGDTGQAVLEKQNVQRKDNGTQFTCHLDCGGQKSKTVYTLQVAYGPVEVSVHAPDPGTFTTNGTKILTLTCTAHDVNPQPVFTWKGVKCEEGKTGRTCSFAPKHWQDGKEVTCAAFNSETLLAASAVYRLDLAYPPPSGPELSPYTPGKPSSCTVKGGKPLVSRVHFACWNDTFPDEPDTRRQSDVVSPLSINTSGLATTVKQVTCRCSARWDPDPTLYTLSTEDVIRLEENAGHLSDSGDGDEGHSSDIGVAVGMLISGLGVIILLATAFFAKRVGVCAPSSTRVGPSKCDREPGNDCPLPILVQPGYDLHIDQDDGLKVELYPEYSSPHDARAKAVAVALLGNTDMGGVPELPDSGDYALMAASPRPEVRHYEEVGVGQEEGPAPASAATPRPGSDVSPKQPQCRGPLGHYYSQVKKTGGKGGTLQLVPGSADTGLSNAGASVQAADGQAAEQQGAPTPDGDDGLYGSLHHHGHAKSARPQVPAANGDAGIYDKLQHSPV